MLRRQLWSFGKRRVEDRGIGPRDEQAGGIAFIIALNFAARRIWWGLGVPACPQRGLIQQRATIQVQNKDRCLGGSGIDFLQRRHSAFGKLKLAPAADYAHPLARRRASGLLLEHSQSVCE